MIAAAVVGGLLLVGTPFLVAGLSGPDDKSPSASGQGPAGSPLGEDGSGPGVVPGQQNAPDNGRVDSAAPGAKGGDTAVPGAARNGTGDALHEGGNALHESSGNGTGPRGEVGQTPVGSPVTGTNAGSTNAGSKTVPAADPKPSSDSGTSGSGSGRQSVQRPTPVTYSHLIGPGCDTTGFATSDRSTNGTKGWRGSWNSQKGYGCNGLFYSLPLSNSTSKPSGAFAQWRFSTGKVTKGTCAVQVYIPGVKDISYVGGSPAHYTVYRSFKPQSSTQVGTFEINQAAHLGQWVSAGTFRVDQARLSVVLDNRGKTSGNRHAAAAPVKISCSE
ncbi:hypothetical protein [Streptomyces sp. YS-3]|uniref:hypothetical protein n=1 Tax=Streptomyces sp. YS-3 TaxID=3381352 RepID=UPI003862CCA1